MFFPGNSLQLGSWCGRDTTYKTGNISLRNINSIDAIFYKNKGRNIVLNGETFTNDDISNNVTNNSETFGLFSDMAEKLNSASFMSIYNWQIIKDNDLVRDYVPALNKSGVPCLFDKVEKKCYYNKGTGEFYYKNKGYSSIEFLESTGKQYIDTGVSGTFSEKIEFKGRFSLNSTKADEQAIIGSKKASNNQGLTLFFPGYSLQLGSWCGSGTTYKTGNISLRNINSIDAIFYKNKGRNIILNGETFKNDDISNNVTDNSETFGLFSDMAEKLNSASFMSIYNWQIIKDNTLVRDYIPYLDETGIPCLYDKVEKKCYYNQGEGEFLWG